MTIRKPPDTELPSGSQDVEPSDPAEGARYALLQRLAPALQHHMMGQFQSMGMIAAMMEKRLQSAEPDLANIRKDCASLGSVSQTAVMSIINLMSWIEPKPAMTVKFDACVKECVGLLATQFRFKGFAIVNEAPEIDLGVSSRALRSVLSAALIVLSDLSQAPADLVIRARAVPGGVEVSIALQAAERSLKSVYGAAYRLLEWGDVEMLAAADAVTLKHDNTAVQLVFSRSHDDLDPTRARMA